MTLRSAAGLLYVRASLRPFARPIRAAGGLIQFLRETFEYDEIFAPHFSGARPIWRAPSKTTASAGSGALGRVLAADAEAVISAHPSHSFVGIGPRVGDVLRQHGHLTSCFYPVGELAERHDFSMLLLGCVDESPGFSTVHAVQHDLGLTRKHLIRHLLRWDVQAPGGARSMAALEAPGCSMSFDKFYSAYSSDANLVEGDLCGQRFLYVPSARKAMAVEREILARNPRFVDCKRWACTTCRLRLY
jgi:aminoglycoside 3-N-acetyltransferase